MGDKSRRHNLNEDDVRVIKSRIIEVCKHVDISFVEIKVSNLVGNLNYIFNCQYSIEDITYVLGLLYEQEFYYKGELESDIRY